MKIYTKCLFVDPNLKYYEGKVVIDPTLNPWPR